MVLSNTVARINHTPIVQKIAKKQGQNLSRVIIPVVIGVTASIFGMISRAKEPETTPIMYNTNSACCQINQRLTSDIKTNNPFDKPIHEGNNPYISDKNEFSYKINYLS